MKKLIDFILSLLTNTILYTIKIIVSILSISLSGIIYFMLIIGMLMAGIIGLFAFETTWYLASDDGLFENTSRDLLITTKKKFWRWHKFHVRIYKE